MEVTLLDVQGLPPGCLVSVRSGTTRRQALADPDKLRLFFPAGLEANPSLKVDLLAPLGSSEIQFQPGANAYPIQLPINGAIGSVTLAIREIEKPVPKMDLNAIASMEYTKDDKGRPSTPGTASRRHRLALAARTYLDDHQLLMFVQSMLQGLIRDRPDDPWDYINDMSLLSKKLGVPEPYKPGSTPRAPPTQGEAVPFFLKLVASNGVDSWAECVGPSRPVLDDDGKLTGPWLEVMRAAVTFEHTEMDWASRDEFANAGPGEMVVDYLQVCGYEEFKDALESAEGEMLAQLEAVGLAACSGSDLHEASPVQTRPTSANPTLASCVELNPTLVSCVELEEQPRPYNLKPSVGTWIGTLPIVATPEELAEMCKKTWSGLLEGSKDGRLDAIIAESFPPKEAVASVLPAPVLPMIRPPSPDLRAKAVASLQRAKQDGTLADLAAQIKGMEQLRKDTKDELAKVQAQMATQQGQLANLEQQKANAVEEEEYDEAKRLKAEITTLKEEVAAFEQNLQKALQEAQAANAANAATAAFDLEDLRCRARGVLLKATKNGSLAIELGGKQRSPASTVLSAELNAKRGDMKKLLAQAASDGTFGMALGDMRATPVCSVYPLPWNLEATPEADCCVPLSLVLLNVDFGLLSLDKALLYAVTMALKECIAREAGDGILLGQVQLELTSGSLVVAAILNLANKAEADSVRSKLLSSMTLSESLLTCVMSVPGIDSVISAPIAVDALNISKSEEEKEPWAEDAFFEPQDEENEMRRTAEKFLQHVGQDAKFCEAFTEVADAAGFAFELKRKSAELSKPGTAESTSLDNLRTQARAKLEEVVLGGGDIDMDILRMQARMKLVEASGDGSFMMALEEASEQASRCGTADVDLEALRKEARGKLLKAANDGNFTTEVLRPGTGTDGDLSDIRGRVRSKMEAAANDGTLEDAMNVARVPPGAQVLFEEDIHLPELVPFSNYYVANFRTGATTVEDMARSLFCKEPRNDPPQEAQKKKEVVYAPPPRSQTSFAELEENILQRNNRFRVENEALRRENARLGALREKKAFGGGVRKNGPDAS